MQNDHDPVMLREKVGSTSNISPKREVATNIALEQTLLEWENDGNLLNPRHWSPGWKWTTIAIVSYIELLTHMTSLMYAPGITAMQRDLHVSNSSIATFSMTAYVLGFSVGPLICSPLSEIYGRITVYRCSTFLFFIFCVACALATNIEMLITFRFFAGCFGASPVAIGGAIVADLFSEGQRGRAMTVYQMGNILGITLGPPIGGIIIQRKGWRWAFWIASILAGFAVLCTMVVLRETYAPRIKQRQAARMKPRQDPKATLNGTDIQKQQTLGILVQALKRPLRLFALIPVVFCIGLLTMLQFGLQNLLFASLGRVFEEDYGFGVDISGLTYLGLTIGCVVAAFVIGKTSDPLSLSLAKHRGEGVQPEFRLLYMITGLPVLAGGLIWYGWTVERHVAWPVPVVSLGLVGVGFMSIQLSAQMYLVDSFTEVAASVLAANTVARSIGGALIPLAGPALYKNLGLGWGNTLLGLVSLGLTSVSVGLFRCGKMLRERYPSQGL